MSHFFEQKNLLHVLLRWVSLKKLRISSFEMWIWDVFFVPFSEKVTCKNVDDTPCYDMHKKNANDYILSLAI